MNEQKTGTKIYDLKFDIFQNGEIRNKYTTISTVTSFSNNIDRSNRKSNLKKKSNEANSRDYEDQFFIQAYPIDNVNDYGNYNGKQLQIASGVVVSNKSLRRFVGGFGLIYFEGDEAEQN
ncbi:hypothetical protein HELRODRAFT_160332 [Helobdella robusta]|uniref:Uncharacterized protein n=1 Tax=Helobdella robusta TaxID=6412 RepID=T1EQ38_HELRO|nr:hypothetical protein HELRODRAFT_160332 [Helobdella robusta]ESO06179.1 hypothetical protein HELRODRAFT_160332 [Helobdella robusta]